MRFFRDDTGMTLTELLVVSVLMVFVLATAYMLFDAASGMADQTEARVVASDNAQKALEQVTRDFRQAQENYDGDGNRPGALAVAKSDTIEFFMDENQDGKPERIKYYMQGSSLMRAVAAPTNTHAVFTHGAFGSPTVVLRNIRADNGAIFCFHATTVDAAATCANGEKHGFNIVSTTSPLTSMPKIAILGINLNNEETVSHRSVSIRTTALVRIRSVENVVE